MARDILAIPAAEMGIKRFFSDAGRVYKQDQSNYNAETFSAIIMCRHFQRNKNAQSLAALQAESTNNLDKNDDTSL